MKVETRGATIWHFQSCQVTLFTPQPRWLDTEVTPRLKMEAPGSIQPPGSKNLWLWTSLLTKAIHPVLHRPVIQPGFLSYQEDIYLLKGKWNWRWKQVSSWTETLEGLKPCRTGSIAAALNQGGPFGWCEMSSNQRIDVQFYISLKSSERLINEQNITHFFVICLIFKQSPTVITNQCR